MPRAGLSPTAVVDVAVAVVDEGGPRALTLAAVATRAEVATPSLYKHVKNLDELVDLVGVRVLDELTERVTRSVVGFGGPAAVGALLRAYRDYAVEHPHRYAMLPQSPRETPGRETAGRRLMDTIFAVLAGCGVTGADAVHLTRCIRAAGHGFATLESQGGFQLAEDIETSFATLTRMVLSALPPVNPKPRRLPPG
ncbi:WHG domain-containing protein [Nocardia rhamnosiphila]|uniref:WHG domain-containing protein n=1 Tax=Nocardia rhamnosiphila TaxID=426716 RepID=UPI0033E44625